MLTPEGVQEELWLEIVERYEGRKTEDLIQWGCGLTCRQKEELAAVIVLFRDVFNDRSGKA